MTNLQAIALFLPVVLMSVACAKDAGIVFESDSIKTSAGDLKITFLGHGSLLFTFDGKIIHTDPNGQAADYSLLPKADLVLITHEHFDHLDLKALEAIRALGTAVVANQASANKVGKTMALNNGDISTLLGLKIEVVPAYNLVHMRDNGEPYHAKGNGNGYIITFGDKRVYVAGDTENVPEMGELGKIDVAFLPMNLPYTMTPEMAAEAARMVKPGILYPYHYGSTDTSQIVALLQDETDIEVRIRKM